MEKKSLYDISLKITEEEYRKDPALSYSTLSRFDREGFEKIDFLFDKVESPSLLLGSLVDCLTTDGFEEYNKRFMVAEFPKISDNLTAIVKKLYVEYAGSYNNLVDIPDEIVSYIAKQCDFWAGDKWDKVRAKKVKEEQGCSDYYHLMFIAKDKIIITQELNNTAHQMYNTLRDSKATEWYFQSDNPFENIERLYQLKFKATLNGIDYRCMMDLAIVDHDKKIIIPCDLKTSFKPEYNFYKSFVEWNYSHQARLYTRILQDVISKDEYFKDFKVLPYRFIVVNKNNLDPLVWEYTDTFKKGIIVYGKDNQIKVRDPESIGQELSYILKYKPKRPKGIDDENDLCEWLKDM